MVAPNFVLYLPAGYTCARYCYASQPGDYIPLGHFIQPAVSVSAPVLAAISPNIQLLGVHSIGLPSRDYVPGEHSEHPSIAFVAPLVIKSVLYPAEQEIFMQLMALNPKECNY